MSASKTRPTWTFCLAVLFAITGISAQAQPPAPASHPNIVFILTDDLGYGDVHSLNPEHCKIETPNLDQLRADGMAFTDCHASSSICTPSRYSILTGRYDWRTHLQSGALPPEAPPLLAPDRLTVGEFLQQHGYTTAIIGKWHLGLKFNKKDFSQPITDGPLQHGFNYFHGLMASLDMPPYVIIENNRFTEIPTVKKKFPSFMYGPNAVPGPVRPGLAAPDFEAVDILPQFTSKAVEYIGARGVDKKPFFLYLALPSPHTPVVPTKEWQGKSSIGPYGDYVMETDWSVGSVLKAIDRAGLHDDTLVIFASDNGCAPYVDIHGLEAMGHYPSAEFRGYKSDVWDGGHRVPFLVRWPGHVKPDSDSGQIICTVDFMATCADILQAKLPANAAGDSVSLLPAFLGTDKQPLHEAIINHSGGNGRFAIRQGNWKLELCPGSGGWGKPGDEAALKEGLPPIQLYNMHDDIGEKTNIEAQNTNIVAGLLKLLEKYVSDGRTTPGPRLTNDIPVNIWHGQNPPDELALPKQKVSVSAGSQRSN